MRNKLALVLAGLALPACGGAPPEVPRPRNLLVICVDTLRADFLGCYGARPARTPNIDRLAESGVLFENAVSHTSWTLPSFASVMTSLYTSSHGCWDFEQRLDESFTTLPELFQQAGFDTAGMASHIFFDGKYGLQQGFDTFDDEYARRRADEGWVPITSPGISEKAVTWLDRHTGGEAPWLLWLHYFDPHIPYVAHEPATADKEELVRYKGEIAFTDEHLGSVLAALERNGLADDTAVLFLSDHGEAFEEHPGVRRHAKSLHREELRVPLILRVPGVEPRRVPEMVRTVDVLPTLLDVFGIQPAVVQPMEGVSLVPAMTGREHVSPPLLSELRLHDGFHADGLIEGRWKLIVDTSRGSDQLYDLEADVEERSDVASEHPDVVARMKVRLERLRERAEELGALYEQGDTVDLSPDELERLRKLGYIGED